MRKTNSLKTFFTMCLLCMVGTLGAWAQTTVTFVAGTDIGETSLTKDGITITLEKGTNKKTGTLNPDKGTEYRIYKGNDLTISSVKGNITKIVFTCKAEGTTQYGPGCFDQQTGYQYKGKIGTWTGDASSVKFNAESAQVRATKIEVTYAAEGTVLPPSISEPSKTFDEPFDVTLSSAEGTSIYYTLDGNVPTTGSTKYNGSPIRIPAATTTIKAIAEKDGKISEVAEAIYTYSETKVGDGTFENPYSPEEVLAKKISGTVWVKGKVIGEAQSSNNGYTSTISQSNIAIGEPGMNKCIAISLPYGKPIRKYFNKLGKNALGKEYKFQGIIEDYFGRKGIKDCSAFVGSDEEPISKLDVKTDEGYATFVSKYPFYVPEGVECGIITGADNTTLNINYKYKEGFEESNIVPAYCPVLVKTNCGKKTYNLVIGGTFTTPYKGANLLKAGTGGKFTADADYLYYKLAYDDYDARTDLGFYWGAANGGAFFVPEGSAYLAVPKSAATSVKSFRLEDATTGITAPIASEGQTVKTVYTIDGRRVQNTDHLTKGLYIVNGKKVMIK